MVHIGTSLALCFLFWYPVGYVPISIPEINVETQIKIVDQVKNMKFRMTSLFYFITSIDCNQHGQRQEVHASGLSKWITSVPWLSVISIPNGRIGPQHIRAQQSDFSFALYTSWPIEFSTLYLFWVSKPDMTSSSSTFCFTRSWSSCDKYSKPLGT